jgi:RNA polymerase sigma-70 factor (ECF subfamily)
MTNLDKPSIEDDWLTSLMVTYTGPLRRFFQRRSREPSEVDDLIQDVFHHLLRRHSNGDIENPQAYLFQIAANILKDRHRRSQTRQEFSHQFFDETMHAYEYISPERILLGRDQLKILKLALLKLPEKTRNIFILQRFEGMRYNEIADHYNISVSAVEKHMMKAIKHLSRKVV